MSARRKLLIETSAVLAALGRTTEAHRAHFDDMRGDAELWSSAYIRKELLLRWFVDYVHLAHEIARSASIADALRRLSNDFSGRAKGSYMLALADLESLRDRCADRDDPRLVARKCAEAALRLVWDFDDVFTGMIQNKSTCQIGAREIPADGNSLITDLVKLCEELRTPVQDCGVNDFLGFGTTEGRAATLLACHEVARSRKHREPLATFAATKRRITCTECARIGDAVIALEHAAQATPSEYALVHVDHAFDRYCPCLGLEHEPLASAIGVAWDGGDDEPEIEPGG